MPTRAVDDATRDPLAVAPVEGGEDLVGHLARADEQQVKVGIGAAGVQSAVNHDGGGVVPAEEVDGDPRGARLHAGRSAWPAGVGRGRSPPMPGSAVRTDRVTRRRIRPR